jgi:UDP-N-acetylglucosamine diphosphorylase/glucosamine-1-phosphate N-acetyltransferase
MRVCIYEDRGVLSLEPLTLTRPAFDLRCGAFTLLERQQRAFAGEFGTVVRPSLAGVTRLQHRDLAVNDSTWLRQTQVFVNARWLPGPEPFSAEDIGSSHVGMAADEVAFVALPAAGLDAVTFDTVDELVQQWKQTLPRREAGGTVMAYPWDLVDTNSRALIEDWRWFRQGSQVPADLAVVGPREQVVVHPSAQLDPFVVVDTRNGPVIIDRGAVVHSFSRLEGPCYIGAETWVLGAKLRGGSIGPKCRIGGEVEASIVHSHSNKYHDGFLGHSYLSEWVNLAAGTQTSDLRNDYGPIRVTINGVRLPTGRTKVGTFFGDHTKTGLNTLLNCGTNVGAFCSLLPAGTYLPTTIPSFAMCNGALSELWDLRQLFQTAQVVMRRRGCELSDAHRDLYFALYDTTSEGRRTTIREHEQRRLRRSV